jgi:hypothetical protein
LTSRIYPSNFSIAVKNMTDEITAKAGNGFLRFRFVDINFKCFFEKLLRRKKMKIKVLAVLGLAAIAGLAGCKGADNTNVATNTNTATVNTNTATTTQSPTRVAIDTAAQTAVKDALDKAGLKDVMVEATANEVTLRGTVAKGKMAEVNRIAQEVGKRKVNNQVVEK